MKKKLLGILFAIIMVFNINVFAYYDAVDDTDIKVYDFANKLTMSEEEEYQEIAEEFNEKYDMDLVIVLVDYGYSAYQIETYADDFYDYNGFGVGDDNSGIIIAIDTSDELKNEYNIAVETTGKAIKRYTDNEIDFIFDHLGDNKYDGYTAMIDGFIEDAKNYSDLEKSPLPWILLILIPILSSTITICIMLAMNKMVKKATTAEAYLDTNAINFTRREDRFVTTHTTRIPINTSSGGGGSSTHHGSSGVSHGGGGRHV